MKLIRSDGSRSSMSPWFSFPTWMDADYFTTDTTNGLNMWDDDNNVYVEVAVPGLDSKDIDVNLSDGVLTIRGVKEEKDEEKRKGKKVYSATLKRNFYYSTSLPSGVDSDKVEANLKSGVLALTIAKSEKAKPRKIQVKSSSE